MATTYKVLGQSCPSTTNLTTLYTVPASTSTVASSIVVANITNAAATFRISVQPLGASVANQHYIAYDVTIAANDSTVLVMGITLATTDVVSVRTNTANALSFNLFGSELT